MKLEKYFFKTKMIFILRFISVKTHSFKNETR